MIYRVLYCVRHAHFCLRVWGRACRTFGNGARSTAREAPRPIIERDQKRRREEEPQAVAKVHRGAYLANFSEFKDGCNSEVVPMHMFQTLKDRHEALQEEVAVIQKFLSKVTGGGR
jgi:hypothetical protein